MLVNLGELKIAKITAIGSDKDSYNDVTLKDGVFLTYSKKLKKYVPIKGKSLILCISKLRGMVVLLTLFYPLRFLWTK